MQLNHISIKGFRGINQILLPVQQSIVLIGENQWGKTSLFDALQLLLSPIPQLYQFSKEDFHTKPEQNNGSKTDIDIILTFIQAGNGLIDSHNFIEVDDALWQTDQWGQRVLYYRVTGEYCGDDNIKTKHCVIDEQKNDIDYPELKSLLIKIKKYSPVLRMPDNQMFKRDHLQTHSNKIPTDVVEKLNALRFEHGIKHNTLDEDQLNKSIDAIRVVVGNYLLKNRKQRYNSTQHLILDNNYWLALDAFNEMITQLDRMDNEVCREWRTKILIFFIGLLSEFSPFDFVPECRPILLFEDSDSRFHPIMLSVVWAFLEHLPLQKLTSTNSGDLLSLIPIQRVCRMIRSEARIKTYQIEENTLSRGEHRRIAFHIRLNRASTLFARYWLLVEGETEIWLINEFARQCGYHLESEGIKVIEFAQCGIRPLIKLAQHLGIHWHVLVDGDDAGKKYAQAVKAFAEKHTLPFHEHLTQLPANDLEGFMFRSGFEEVFYDIAGVDNKAQLSPRKLIHKVIQKTSKPDLAIEIAERAEQFGSKSIPLLFRNLFSHMVHRARQRFNGA